MSEYSLNEDDALSLTATVHLADYFETCARVSGNPRAAVNWMLDTPQPALEAAA
jgi:Asp-tRNA(Asn)/Glu-tRNA(Gln) amidotransferase B subunit